MNDATKQMKDSLLQGCRAAAGLPVTTSADGIVQVIEALEKDAGVTPPKPKPSQTIDTKKK